MKRLSEALILSVVAALWGCSTTDDIPDSAERVWETSLMATNLDVKIENIGNSDDIDDDNTRSLFMGGQSGTNFIKLWDNSDVVQVYKDGAKIGTMTPLNKGYQISAMSGTLTGELAEGDVLTLYMPSVELDYTGQDGTIGTMSTYFDYMKTTTKVSSINGTKVTTENVAFASLQSYLMFRFRDENNKLLHLKQVIVHAPSGKLVATKSMDGTTTYTNEYVINIPKVHAQVDDYPTDIYIAVLNENTAKESYSFIVTAANGKIYKSTASVTTKLNIGKLATSRHAVYCSTVDVNGQTAITPPESDDPDVEQVTL